MKNTIHFTAMISFVVLSMTTVSLAQDTEGKVKNNKTLAASEVKSKIEAKMADRNDNAVKKISKSLQSKGYKAENGFFGNESSFELDGATVTQTILIQDYKKGNTAGAMGMITISDGKNQDAYTFSLEKTGNSATDVAEYYVDSKGEVVKANSWYTCLRSKLNALCGGTVHFDNCWSAYSSWTSFAKCIMGIVCGVLSGPKAFACCSCDCSWWCKWAAGCCDR